MSSLDVTPSPRHHPRAQYCTVVYTTKRTTCRMGSAVIVNMPSFSEDVEVHMYLHIENRSVLVT
jgi:hypothetical protein